MQGPARSDQVQATMWHRGSIVTDIQVVRNAVRDMFGEGLIVDEIPDGYAGDYFVQLPRQALEVLSEQRYLEVTNGDWILTVE